MNNSVQEVLPYEQQIYFRVQSRARELGIEDEDLTKMYGFSAAGLAAVPLMNAAQHGIK